MKKLIDPATNDMEISDEDYAEIVKGYCCPEEPSEDDEEDSDGDESDPEDEVDLPEEWDDDAWDQEMPND